MQAVFLHHFNLLRFNRDDSLNNQVVNLAPDETRINPNAFKMLTESSKAPFMPHIVFEWIFILYKFVAFLLNAVVRQMHVFV
jgi:hypothetical protein